MWRHYRQLGYVYTKVGIVADLAASTRRGLVGQAATMLARLPSPQWRHPLRTIHQTALTTLKGLAFALGARAARKKTLRRSTIETCKLPTVGSDTARRTESAMKTVILAGGLAHG